jgi:hypothetical protein
VSRRLAHWWTGICLALAAAAVGVTAWVWPAAAPAVTPQPQHHGVVAASVVGEVQVRHQGSTWETLTPQHRLVMGDEIRTGDFSEAVLLGHNGSSLVVSPNTRFTIGADTAQVSRFTLGTGRVAADIRRRQRTYEFGAGGGEARADTQGGQFSLTADGKGLLGVVTRRGKVGLSAKGKRVVVPAGKQAVVMPGAAPGDPLPIPQDVFLQVKWPSRPTDADTVAVAGRTDTGAQVRIGGQTVQVDPDGHFQVQVPLKEGANHFVVSAVDAAGNARRVESPSIVRQTKRPSLELKTKGSIWE